MAETKTKNLNVYRALQIMRVALQEKDIKKSGHNDYGKYDYFELSDFLPEINKLALENNIVCIYELVADKEAILHIADMDNYENRIDFKIPIAELSLKGANAIQNVGGLTTYTRRYLYMIAFEIAENDEFDPTQQNTAEQDTNTADEPKNQEKERKIQQKTISDKDVNALCSLIEKKGVSDESVLDRYRVNTFDELTFEQFNAAMKILSNMKDKEV